MNSSIMNSFYYELFNHELFNHELFNYELFNYELFRHELVNQELFINWKSWSRNVQDWNVLQPTYSAVDSFLNPGVFVVIAKLR